MIAQEIRRFLIVGGTTVLIDFVAYTMLITLELETDISKGISFTVGAVFAYFANRLYTFNKAHGGILRFIYFMALYLTTLAINVTTNEVILNHFGRDSIVIGMAFLVATGLSATLNFIGMKFVIFTTMRTIEK